MLQFRTFDHVVLISTPRTMERTAETVAEIEHRWPDRTVEVKDMDKLDDPTDHVRILRYLRRFVRELLAAHQQAIFSVSISSGTPSMHACWLLLVAEGTLPARLLYGHPPRVVGEDGKISEVNLDSDQFPNVVAPSLVPDDDDSAYVPDLQTVRDELGIIGDDPGFCTALERVARLAQYEGHILLLGETGSGKEEFARLTHRVSRRTGAFVAINCAAIPDALAESVLFGHKKGAFTGAQQDQDGEFVNAHGGTLFLDEVGDMPAEIQAKLLRVLQDGAVRAIGAKTDRKVDVRVIAATNANLQQAIRENRFRADLAQRFIDTVQIPPLRQRRGDIAKLAAFALMAWNLRHGEDKKLTRDAMAAMQTYNWPGNVRELLNTVKRAAMLSRQVRITPEDLRLGEASWLENQTASFAVPEPHEGFDVQAYLGDQRQKLFRRALELADGNQAAAARLLGVSAQAIHKFLTEQERSV